MVICPCSTSTLSSIATGASNTLIERGADVMIKERRQLILVPREMPFSAIHLEHMHKLALLGVTIMPACPGFITSRLRWMIWSTSWWRAFSIILVWNSSLHRDGVMTAKANE